MKFIPEEITTRLENEWRQITVRPKDVDRAGSCDQALKIGAPALARAHREGPK